MTTAAIWNWNHSKRVEKTRVRNGALTVGLGFISNTNLGSYFMILDSFATVERGKIIILKYLLYRKHMKFKNDLWALQDAKAAWLVNISTFEVPRA